MVGVRRKNLRIVLMGEGGVFVGIHLVERILERGNNVIFVDDLFSGRKENIMHHLNNPRFELTCHNVFS